MGLVLLRHIVRTPEGFLVDPVTGEVLDDQPIDYKHPEYRIFDAEDYYAKAHYIQESLPRPSKEERLVEKAVKGGSLAGDEYWKLVSRLGELAVEESRAWEIGGVLGLTVFRCLREMGVGAKSAVRALEHLYYGSRAPGKLARLARELHEGLREAVSKTLIRWIAKPQSRISLEHVQKVFGVKISKGVVRQAIVSIESYKVQITSSKVDISAKLNEKHGVELVLAKLSEMLGVKFYRLQPKVATIVLSLPFEVNLVLLHRYHDEDLVVVRQSHRIKVATKRWTMLVQNSKENSKFWSLSAPC